MIHVEADAEPFVAGDDVGKFLRRVAKAGAREVLDADGDAQGFRDIGEGDEGFRQITIINNDSTRNDFNINAFAVDSLTTVQIKNNVPIVITGSKTDTIHVVGLSDKKLIFRINETK